MGMTYDVIVIGAGLAGLVSATALAQAGKRVLLLARGAGCTHLSSGCVDVLGRAGGEDVSSPGEALPAFMSGYPEHPYARVGMGLLAEALDYFRRETDRAGWPYEGGLDANWQLPTAAGAARPTCLAPASMVEGDVRRSEPMLLVGFRELRDFYPQYAAANLSRVYGLEARGAYLDVPALRGRDNITPVELARAFDDPDFRAQVLRALKPLLGDAKRVGFPAVLGLRDRDAWREVSAEIDRPIFEIPTLPPSAPGLRLFEAWRQLFRQAGGRWQVGFPVVSAERQGGRVHAVYVQSTTRPVRFAADHFVLATGGIYGHGLVTDHTGAVEEPILGLPLRNVPDPEAWSAPHPYGPHPILAAGVAVNERMQPIDERGRPVLENVHVAGALLAGGADPRAGIGDGVPIATGYAAARAILG
ncbi:MAG: glycerol-3-phosphate dehydrogenase subunit GlpB [Chloroflexi bacterium]|nr:glycerol-3-phosphate dehydrogenase subunit GlpB [Chloroflexota bacterium]